MSVFYLSFPLFFLFIFYLIKKKNLLRIEIPFYDWYNLDGNTGTSCLLVMLNCTLKVHLFQQILHIAYSCGFEFSCYVIFFPSSLILSQDLLTQTTCIYHSIHHVHMYTCMYIFNDSSPFHQSNLHIIYALHVNKS